MWIDKVCFSIMFFVFDVDVDEVIKVIMGDYIDKIYSVCVNYIYLMFKMMMVGVEYVYVKCEIDVGLEGDMNCV